MVFLNELTFASFERIKDNAIRQPIDLEQLTMLATRLREVYIDLQTLSECCTMNEYRRQLLLSLLTYAVNRGVSAEQICQTSDVSIEALSKPNCVLSPAQQKALWMNTSRLCGDELLGLHFGESLQLSALGAVGEIVKSSDTVGNALTVACSLVSLVTDLYKMGISHSDTTITMTLERVHATSNASGSHANDDDFVARQVADFLTIFTVHELDGLVLKKIVPLQVVYPYQTNSLGEYSRAFRKAPIKKGAEMSITVSSIYWDVPIVSANHDLQKMFLEKVSVSMEKGSANFEARVRDFLTKNAYLGICSLEDVAANFSMTPRSLQRRLRDESVTFQELADGVRKSLALYYLQSGKYQIKEISQILGYNELSAFSRAFKRWTGKSPAK